MATRKLTVVRTQGPGDRVGVTRKGEQYRAERDAADDLRSGACASHRCIGPCSLEVEKNAVCPTGLIKKAGPVALLRDSLPLHLLPFSFLGLNKREVVGEKKKGS